MNNEAAGEGVQQNPIFKLCCLAEHTLDLHRTLWFMKHIHRFLHTCTHTHTYCEKEQCEVAFKGKRSTEQKRQKTDGIDILGAHQRQQGNGMLVDLTDLRSGLMGDFCPLHLHIFSNLRVFNLWCCGEIFKRACLQDKENL